MNLANHLLIAMPHIDDAMFSGSIVLICEHNEQGAMGIIINKPASVDMDTIFHSTGKATPLRFVGQDVLLGGPVQPERGFMLHSPIGKWQSSLPVSENIALTTSRDILEGLNDENQVNDALLTIGYASWTKGQLEQEIARNDWLVVDADADVLFKLPLKERYQAAFAKLGVAPEQLMGVLGHA